MRNKALLIFSLCYFPLNGLEILLYDLAGYSTGGGVFSYCLSLAVYFGGCALFYERKENRNRRIS